MKKFVMFAAAVLLFGMAAPAARADGYIYVYNTSNYYVTRAGYGLYDNSNVTLPSMTLPPYSVNPNPVQYGSLPNGYYTVTTSYPTDLPTSPDKTYPSSTRYVYNDIQYIYYRAK